MPAYLLIEMFGRYLCRIPCQQEVVQQVVRLGDLAEVCVEQLVMESMVKIGVGGFRGNPVGGFKLGGGKQLDCLGGVITLAEKQAVRIEQQRFGKMEFFLHVFWHV